MFSLRKKIELILILKNWTIGQENTIQNTYGRKGWGTNHKDKLAVNRTGEIDGAPFC